jgi:hypothetical protein
MSKPQSPSPPLPSSAAPSSKPKGRGGRPRGPEPQPPVTGFRVPLALLARLDALVVRRAAELAPLGGKTSRAGLVVAALVEYCDREEARHAASDGDAAAPRT